MNFTQMHERLRLELLRRIQRGTLSVSLLARQTGLGQSHLSNFLHLRRQLSFEATDRVLAAQQMDAGDLLPASYLGRDPPLNADTGAVPLISHASALFEPYIRPSAVRAVLTMPLEALQSARPRASSKRSAWQRFIAVRVAALDALAMEPLVLPESVVLVDRHYTSLMPYRPNRPTLYAVRHGSHLTLRFLDFLANRLVLRPYNIAFPIDLVELGPSESPADLIVGRIALVINEL